MSFKKNLLFLLFWGCITSYSSLFAQIRRPGSENETKPASSTATTKSSTTSVGASSNTNAQSNSSGSGINSNAVSSTNQSNSNVSTHSSANLSTVVPTANIPALIAINKQKKGNYNVEALVSIGNSGIGIGVDEFKGRYFYSNKRAYRARFSGIIKNDLNDISPNKTTRAEVKYDRQRLLIAGGFEEHYNHSNRINSYLGFEAGGWYDKESTKASNSKDGISFTQGYSYEKTLTESALFINGVTGLDYYLNSQFYIGAELMVGVSNRTSNYSGIRVSAGTTIESQDGFYSGSGFEGHLTYSKGIRLGYKF
jgi:hypothetical protein